jgi:hypothetical protein
LELASLSPEMREQLRHDISAIEHGIQVAEESQVKLKKWEVENIKQGHITDPFVGYIRQVIITTEYHRLLLFCSSQILFNISNKILQNSIYPV